MSVRMSCRLCRSVWMINHLTNQVNCKCGSILPVTRLKINWARVLYLVADQRRKVDHGQS